jgi:glycosyltransferase involved in cell wall biosynthesis
MNIFDKNLRKEITVVVPAHNEAGEIATVVSNIERALRSVVAKLEIIVVDDGSTDETPEILSGLLSEGRIRVVRHQVNRGYGAALRSGFSAASSDFVSFIDGDGQLDPADLRQLLACADRDTFAIGYRKQRNDPAFRVLLGAVFSRLFVPLAIGIRVRDVDCALKVFPAQYFRMVTLRADGALINAELLAHARTLGYRIEQIPVAHYARTHGEQSGAKLSVVLKVLKELWHIRKTTRHAELQRAAVIPAMPMSLG